MRRASFGSTGLDISRIGASCMASPRMLERALELGVNFFDAADSFEGGRNEDAVGGIVRRSRERVFVATTFGIAHGARAACDASLRRLGVECIDLYSPQCLDPNVPLEETVGAMAQLVYAGKVRYLGLRDASAREIERACTVFPIAALQARYSPFARAIENDGSLAAARRFGMAVVARAALGPGALVRPGLAERIGEIAAQTGSSAAQVSLAWVLARGADVFMLPNSARVRDLEEHAAGAGLVLGADHMARLENGPSATRAGGAL